MIQSMSMNRKQRRLQDKKAGKSTPPVNKKTQENAARAAELKAQGMALKNAGKEIEAIPFLSKALSLDSSLADAHFALAMIARMKSELALDMEKVNKGVGNRKALHEAYQKSIFILKKRKQYQEALICQEEICRLFPSDLDEEGNYALLLTIAGQKETALRIIAGIMEKAPSEKKYKAVFVNACSGVALKTFDPIIKRAVQTLFNDIYEANLLKAYTTWISLVLHDPACSGIRSAETVAEETAFSQWIESATPEALSFLKERFFLDGLRMLIVTDPVMERFLVRLRKWICLNFIRLVEEGRLDFFEPFLLALGEQCFFNEYIYEQTQAEKDFIQNLIKDLSSNENTGIPKRQAYALTGCYYSLFKSFPDGKDDFKTLSALSKDFANFAKSQFFDPLEEEKIKPALRTFGQMEDNVSKNVQAQYEENPYPRWISVITFPVPADGLPVNDQERYSDLKILIAGCGTGRHAIDTAATYPAAKVTAIDLSRASLAYAQRKAREAGLAERIEFIHADILNMDKWPGQFDIVESSGVLHHMKDPFKGWQVLTNLLKPGGHFKIGLYSETARKCYVEAQEFVKANGIPPTLEGIRACRKAILEMPTTSMMRQIVSRSGDFYSASLVRDLLFHVQEHRMNLPQIKEMMDRLELTCTRFMVSEVETLRKYDKKYPQDINRSNMLYWHEFEQKNPFTFLGMYQFWCRKAG